MPLHGPVLAFDGGVFIAQEPVGGRWSDSVGADLARRLLDCWSLHIGRGVRIDPEPWGRFILRTLRVGADGWALHEPLRRHSRATKQVLDWVEAVGRQYDERDFHEHDLVHIDFHHRNVLQTADGALSAIVDWEGARQGDAAFDLVTLAFGLAAASCQEPVRERVWDQAAAWAGDNLAAYVAHMTLRRLDWTIRFHAEDVAFWLAACRKFMEAANA
jgi:thiamine kinase-like enzyme